MMEILEAIDNPENHKKFISYFSCLDEFVNKFDIFRPEGRLLKKKKKKNENLILRSLSDNCIGLPGV